MLAVAHSPGQLAEPASLVGKPAPALKVDHWLNTGGADLSLKKLAGKVVVLDYWAYW